MSERNPRSRRDGKMLTDTALQMLIDQIDEMHPNPDGTFAEILMYLRELQRFRAAMPKRIHPVTHPAQKGWNKAVEAMERVIKQEMR